MVHVAIRAVPGTLLFHNWREARELWVRLAADALFIALVLMPDHLHAVLATLEQRALMAKRLSGYARWRNAARGEQGAVFEHRAKPEPVEGVKHERRTLRCVYLNPCRAGLVDDPLAWPFSSYRDAVGLAIPTLVAPSADPVRLHAYVSGDPSVRPDGTMLPAPPAERGAIRLESVFAAVSALTRTPRSDLRVRGGARDLFVRAARILSSATLDEIAAMCDLDVSGVRRRDAWVSADIRLIARVAGDPRFGVLEDADLRRLSAWRAYRARRWDADT